MTCSHEVSPEFREYERTVTTVINAYLRPACRPYLRRLAALTGEVLVMTSAGGLIPLEEAAERPVSLLVSGPAGGVLAGGQAAVAAGMPDAVTLDMGGTSTDVCLIRDGRPEPAAQRSVAGLPVRLPALDVHTIGAGGGSIALIDPGGALVVGPASAGADPGSGLLRPRRGAGDGDRRRPGGRPHPGVGGPCPAWTASTRAAAERALRPGRRRRPRGHHRRRRQHGARPATGLGGARRRPEGPGSGRLRWRRAPARLRPGRRLGDESGDHPAPGGRPLGHRAAGRAPPG